MKKIFKVLLSVLFFQLYASDKKSNIAEQIEQLQKKNDLIKSEQDKSRAQAEFLYQQQEQDRIELAESLEFDLKKIRKNKRESEDLKNTILILLGIGGSALALTTLAHWYFYKRK